MSHPSSTSGLAGIAMLAVLLVCAAPVAAHPPADAPTSQAPAKLTAAKAKPRKAEPALDLNTASKVQLRKLPWIGEAEADRILAARPYVSKADVVANAGIPVGVYQVIRHRIAVFPKTMPHPKS